MPSLDRPADPNACSPGQTAFNTAAIVVNTIAKKISSTATILTIKTGAMPECRPTYKRDGSNSKEPIVASREVRIRKYELTQNQYHVVGPVGGVKMRRYHNALSLFFAIDPDASPPRFAAEANEIASNRDAFANNRSVFASNHDHFAANRAALTNDHDVLAANLDDFASNLDNQSGGSNRLALARQKIRQLANRTRVNSPNRME